MTLTVKENKAFYPIDVGSLRPQTEMLAPNCIANLIQEFGVVRTVTTGKITAMSAIFEVWLGEGKIIRDYPVIKGGIFPPTLVRSMRRDIMLRIIATGTVILWLYILWRGTIGLWTWADKAGDIAYCVTGIFLSCCVIPAAASSFFKPSRTLTVALFFISLVPAYFFGYTIWSLFAHPSEISYLSNLPYQPWEWLWLARGVLFIITPALWAALFVRSLRGKFQT
jgi:hypothetical protein